MRLSTEPGFGKSRDCLHAENLLKRFVNGAAADKTGVEDDDEDASGFCRGGEDMTVDDDDRALLFYNCPNFDIPIFGKGQLLLRPRPT